MCHCRLLASSETGKRISVGSDKQQPAPMPTMKNQDEDNNKKREEKLLFSSNEPGFSTQRDREKNEGRTQRQQQELNLTVCDEGWPEKMRPYQNPNTKLYMRLGAKPDQKQNNNK